MMHVELLYKNYSVRTLKDSDCSRKGWKESERGGLGKRTRAVTRVKRVRVVLTPDSSEWGAR